MKKVRRRKPVAMVELWKGTVFDAKLAPNNAGVGGDIKSLQRWLEHQFKSLEYLQHTDKMAYLTAIEVGYDEYIFTRNI
jgi:hypothetical protein